MAHLNALHLLQLPQVILSHFDAAEPSLSQFKVMDVELRQWEEEDNNSTGSALLHVLQFSSGHQWPIWFILKRSIRCCHIWTCWKLFLVFKIELRKRRWQSQSEPFDGGDFGWDVLWRGCNLLGEIRFWFLFVKINFKFFAKSIWFFKLKLLNYIFATEMH